MMHKVLVSLCNLFEPGFSGLLLIADGGASRLVDIGAIAKDVLGCTGLWVCNSVIYCASIGSDQTSYITVLDAPELKVIERIPLQAVRDVHSVAARDGSLYVVSTGTNEVHRLETRAIGARSEVLWRADASCRDTHHINAILPVNERLLCSAFGPRMSERWSSAVNGYVVDVGSGRLLWSGIEHPHSLAVGPDDTYIAESRRAQVRGLDTGRAYPVDGYARGLAFSADGLMFVGVSRGRGRSRISGTIENPADPGEPAGASGLSLFNTGLGSDVATGALIDVSAYGPEIYDVVLLTP